MIECPKCGFRNSNGTEFCQSCRTYLGYQGRKLDPGPGGVALALSPANVVVEPGKQASCELSARNRGNIVDQFAVSIVGPTSAWTIAEPATLSLFPGSEGTSRILFHPPRSPDVSAGQVTFTLKVESKAQPGVFATQDGILEIARFGNPSAELVPRTSRGTSSANHRLAVMNGGNFPLVGTLEGSDPDESLSFAFEPPMVTVQPGATQYVQVEVRPIAQLKDGPPQPHAFKVTVRSPEQPALVAEAAMLQEPAPPAAPPSAPRRRFPIALAVIPILALLLVAVGLYQTGAFKGLVPDSTAPSSKPSSKATTSAAATVSVTPKSTTFNVVASGQVLPNNFNVVTARCPAGTVAVAGGVDAGDYRAMKVTSSSPTFGQGTRLLATGSGTQGAPTGWQGAARNESATPQQVKVAVVCSSSMQGASTIVSSSSVAPGNFASVRVTCPDGTVALGGGIDLNSVFTMYVTSSAPTLSSGRLFLQAAAGPNPAAVGWQASAKNEANQIQILVTAVICAPTSGSSTTIASSPLVASKDVRAVAARCPAGQDALGGGIDVQNVLTMSVTSSGPLYPQDKSAISQADGQEQSGVGWQASSFNADPSAQPFSVAVICVPRT